MQQAVGMSTKWYETVEQNGHTKRSRFSTFPAFVERFQIQNLCQFILVGALRVHAPDSTYSNETHMRTLDEKLQ